LLTICKKELKNSQEEDLFSIFENAEGVGLSGCM